MAKSNTGGYVRPRYTTLRLTQTQVRLMRRSVAYALGQINQAMVCDTARDEEELRRLGAMPLADMRAGT